MTTECCFVQGCVELSRIPLKITDIVVVRFIANVRPPPFTSSLKRFVVQELTTGSIMNFILSTEGCLGPLTFLRIWHDNSGHGKHKGWFLDQLQITDLQTGEKYEIRHSVDLLVVLS